MVALLCACTPHNDPAETLADYNGRLARLLDVETPVPAAIRVPTWPQLRSALPGTGDVRFDLFGFPDAGRCGLLQELNNRSREQARQPTPPQNLLQQMRLLRALDQCARLTAGDLQGEDVTRRAFAVAVRDALEQKRRDLPLVYWRSTLGSAEFRDFFSVGAVPLRPGDTAAAVDAASAIAWLAALGRLRPDAPLPAADAVNTHYYRLVGNKLGGRTWLSVDLAMRELDRASSMLEGAPVARLCPGRRPGATAERLHGLYQSHYRHRLQPWLEATARSAGMLADALEQLWQAQQVEAPAELVQYRQSVWAGSGNSLVRDHEFALRRHARAWQVLLASCGYIDGDH
ncbi:MAG: DUF3080 family protein [Gammaproteobacteria bacterium]